LLVAWLVFLFDPEDGGSSFSEMFVPLYWDAQYDTLKMAGFVVAAVKT
jgi:hypothetical protein